MNVNDLNKYIPVESLDLILLQDDIRRIQEKYCESEIARRLGKGRASLNHKLHGRRKFTLLELVEISSLLGQGIKRYIKTNDKNDEFS